MSSTIHTSSNRHALIIVLAGGCVLAISFGVRSVFGGIVEPLSRDLFGGKLEVFSLSIAIQNLVWGLAQPVFGLVADKFGDRRALWLGMILYLAGMVICITGTSPIAQHLGAGFLVGLGISGTAFGVVMAVVGRAAPVDKRGTYLGFASALGSVGQVVIPLLMSWFVTWLDWQTAMIIITCLLLPMAIVIPFLKSDTSQARNIEPELPLGKTIKQAFGHKSYILLFAGFFVCGFHLAFITAHFPNFVQKFCLSSASAAELRALGLQALALVGLANIFGTLYFSHLGNRFPRPYILAFIYAARSVVILIFISLPITPVSVLVFAAMMGVLWLSTVPLTSALVLTMFGPRAIGTLFGFVFLSHQLGSFVGVWLGGRLFDIYAHYDHVWNISIALGVITAIAHLMVKEAPAPKLAANSA